MLSSRWMGILRIAKGVCACVAIGLVLFGPSIVGRRESRILSLLVVFAMLAILSIEDYSKAHRTTLSLRQVRILKVIRLACVISAYSLVFVTNLIGRMPRVVLFFLLLTVAIVARVIEVLSARRQQNDPG